MTLAPDDPRHGRTTGYRRGCRCPACRRAMALTQARRVKRLYLNHGAPLSVPSFAMQRRIQALVALGWSLAEISRDMGLDRSAAQLMLNRHGPMWERTAVRVRATYDRLSMRMPPENTPMERRVARRARDLANRNGWAPPLAWDEDTIDDPDACPNLDGGAPGGSDIDHAVVARWFDGETRMPTTAAERREITRRWRAKGWSLNELARRTGWKLERYGAYEHDEVAG